ncbi:protein DpdH [Alishewanella tabrizica]|uniref:ATP-binding protein n=1 Tax=Alishewanella tabrizica TaxID=671278 RepID=A0ABQ2WSY7_9ALTE|nr:protein DpdH [Alishewanella tabrizica]GGW72422.1 hypothetical protein GCM10008111_30680 [Alishewanella tabrizica]
MSLDRYWPSVQNVIDCIKTEAEELSDETLLAVHEPMQLTKFSSNKPEEEATEKDLLDHFLRIDRPIPIVADAGLGKSHLIRWLHAKLKNEKIVQEENWQIVRIPKNASLRQTLHLLLNGLEGDVFESARKQVDEVGNTLVARKIADLFGTHLKHGIQDIGEESVQLLDNCQPGSAGAREVIERIQFAKQLPNLVDDIEFKLRLISDDSYIYNIATRWIKGATEEELRQKEFALSQKDFDSIIEEIEIDNLSLPGRKALSALRLDSNPEQSKKALEVINEGVGRASQTAFQQLFQFGSGNFQDLFKEIRKHLKARNQTLVILVEDLAAISAIEDVLIDCLLEEPKDELCTLKSVLAVTSGYSGYTRRQNTIRTRARFEWQIKNNQDSQEEIPTKIVDFCSRYLNAARYGKSQLQDVISLEDWDDNIPIWNDELDESDSLCLEAFGKSSLHIPLFPFNKEAIVNLAKWYCSNDSGSLIFNPRDVLNDILLNILRYQRNDYEAGIFPKNVELKERKPTLLAELSNLGLATPQQAITLCSIWSDKSSMEALRSVLPKEVAISFNLSELAPYLGSEIHIPTPSPAVIATPKPVETAPISIPSKSDFIEEQLGRWFNNEAPIDSKLAKDFRSQLYTMIEESQLSEWVGFKNSKVFESGKKTRTAFEAILKSEPHFLIKLPNSNNNNALSLVEFCSEHDFYDEKSSNVLQRTALAIIRYHRTNKDNPSTGWNYEKGYEDFAYYKSFAEKWVPHALKVALKALRKKYLVRSVDKQLMLLNGLGLKEQGSLENTLFMKSVHIKSILKEPLNSVFEQLRTALLDQWDDTQMVWSSLVLIDNVAIDSDILKAAIKEARKNGEEKLDPALRRLKKAAIDEIKPNLLKIKMFIGDCENREEFQKLLEDIREVYKSIQDLGLYPDEILKRKTADQDIKILLETLSWIDVKNAIKLITVEDEQKEMEILANLDGKLITLLSKVLSHWEAFEKLALPKIQLVNKTVGANQLNSLNQSIKNTNANLSQTLSDLTSFMESDSK